jgi:hypothetical protein
MRVPRWLAVWLLGGALVGAAAVAAQTVAAQTDPTPMPIPTPTIETPTPLPTLPFTWISPTPDETGAITVIVQPGESLWIIAARAGLTLPELLAMNNLTEADVINPGDVLLIGQGIPGGATPEAGTPLAGTPGGSPTPTLPPPTLRPTETRAEAAICLLAFDDLNRDGIHDAGEPLRAGVAFTIYNTEAVVANYISDGVSEPKCLRGLLPGEYRVTRSIASGEVLTTSGDWALSLTAGSELRQEFGSVIGAAGDVANTAAAGAVAGLTTPAAGGGQSPAATPAANNAPTTATNPTAPAAQPSAPTVSFSLDWRIAGVAVLFVGGLLLLGAVLILLFRQPRGTTSQPPRQQTDSTPERRFRDLDDM